MHNALALEVARRVRRTAPQPLSILEIPDALLTVETVSTVTGMSQSSLYRMAKSGELVPVRRGNRCTRYKAAHVKAWLTAQAAK